MKLKYHRKGKSVRTSFRVATAGLGLAVVAGIGFAGATAASAAAPGYEPDPQAVGTLALYDASGNPVTSGDINSPIATYAVGSATIRSGDVSAVIQGASPNPTATSAASSSWSTDQWTGFSAYPITSGAPSSIQTMSQTHPVATILSTDETVAGQITNYPNDPAHDTNTAYQNLYQIRLETANTQGTYQTDKYDELDIKVVGNTWFQVYPVVPLDTSTTLTATPNPASSGQSISLSATETAVDGTHPAGSVQFQADGANVGSAVPVNASGVATGSTSFTVAAGNPPATHNLAAVFTPSSTTSFNASTSKAVVETVTAPVPTTSTTLAVTQDGTAGHDVNLTATVSPSAAPGSVAFYDNNSATAIPGTVTNPTAGQYVLDLPTGLGVGPHSIVAKFTPTNSANFQASQSAPSQFSTFAAATGACDNNPDPVTGAKRLPNDPRSDLCTDPQGIQVTVPVGTLVITTPYTAAAPLDLGQMGLINNSGEWQATGTFQNIQVNDTRSGNLPYSINALSNTLTTTTAALPGTVNQISAENVGLTNLVEVDSNGYAGTSVPHNNTAAEPAVQSTDNGSVGLGGLTSHDVFDTNHGVGTVTLNGTLTIKAPLNTSPGVYTGTITFTVG